MGVTSLLRNAPAGATAGSARPGPIAVRENLGRRYRTPVAAFTFNHAEGRRKAPPPAEAVMHGRPKEVELASSSEAKGVVKTPGPEAVVPS